MRTKTIRSWAIAGAVLASLAGPAAAQSDWLLVSDSAEGDTRFLVDVGRFDYRVNQHGTHVFGLPLRAVGIGTVSDGYVVINAKGCVGRGGEMIMAIGNTSQRYWWSTHGRRMYDAVAASVCAIAATKYEAGQAIEGSAPEAGRTDAAARRL